MNTAECIIDNPIAAADIMSICSIADNGAVKGSRLVFSSMPGYHLKISLRRDRIRHVYHEEISKD